MTNNKKELEKDKDKEFEKFEWKLYNYNLFKIEIVSYQLDIKNIKNDYITFGSMDYSLERTGTTNSISNPIEDFSIEKEEEIERLRYKIRRNQIIVDKIDNALRLLDDKELLLVRKRYLAKKPMSWQKVAKELDLTENRCQQLRKVIFGKIKDLL